MFLFDSVFVLFDSVFVLFDSVFVLFDSVFVLFDLKAEAPGYYAACQRRAVAVTRHCTDA